MKFVNISTIEKVKNYQVCNENLMYCNKNTDLILNDKLIVENNESYFCDEKFIGYYIDNQTVMVDVDGGVNNRLEVHFHPNNFFNNTFTTSKNYFKNEKARWESDLYLYQFNPFKEIKKYDRSIEGGLIRLKCGFVQTQKTLIEFLDIKIATPLWAFDLKGFGEYTAINNERHSYEIKFFLGVYKNCLLVQLSNATFIWLDINKGELKCFLCLNESHPLPKPVFYDDCFKAYIAGDKLVILNNQRLLHIDLASYEVRIIKDYYTEERPQQYRFMHSTFFEDKLYFVADYGWQYVTPSYVGVMDANNGEVLWQQQLENTGGLSEAPQVTKEKLYIRTNNNVLHIFEKEE